MPSVGVLLPLILLASGLPKVEDPIPERIGLDTVFTAAGFGGVVAGIAFIAAPARRRESAIRWGGLLGFVLGAALYLTALVNQLLCL
jgi:hypothetical protein